MSICDLLLSLKFWLALVTQAPVSMERSKFVCLLSAITGNFFAIATISWYFVISVCVYAVFQHSESRWRWFLQNEGIQHVYVWGLSTFGAFLPWWSYGDMDDGTQCWISDFQDPMRLTMELPLYIYLLFACYLLYFVFFISKASVLNAWLRERMLAFVGVFTIVWIWPTLATTWSFISPETLPLGLHYMDVGAICGSGFFNFLVWITHPAYRNLVCSCSEPDDLTSTNISLNNSKDSAIPLD